MAKSESGLQLFLFWAASAITFCLYAFWSGLSFVEWWTVAVQKKTNNYVFNGIPWYYESAELYAKVMLAEGVIILAVLVLAIYSIIKKKTVMIYFILITVYSFLNIVYGQTV